eukprot:g22940.t1
MAWTLIAWTFPSDKRKVKTDNIKASEPKLESTSTKPLQTTNEAASNNKKIPSRSSQKGDHLKGRHAMVLTDGFACCLEVGTFLVNTCLYYHKSDDIIHFQFLIPHDLIRPALNQQSHSEHRCGFPFACLPAPAKYEIGYIHPFSEFKLSSFPQSTEVRQNRPYSAADVFLPPFSLY